MTRREAKRIAYEMAAHFIQDSTRISEDLCRYSAEDGARIIEAADDIADEMSRRAKRPITPRPSSMGTCSACGRHLRAVVPPGSDGTVRVATSHLNGAGDCCQGSRQIIAEDL